MPLLIQIGCVKRELAMRKNVYERRVAAGRMTRAAANQEIANMEAVLATVIEAWETESALTLLRKAAGA